MKKRKADKSKIILIIQAVMMYLLLLLWVVTFIISPNEISEEANDTMAYIIYAQFALLVLVCILSVIFACLHFVREQENPLKTVKIVKACLIPWFALNYVAYFCISLGLLYPVINIASAVILAFGVVVTYICMFTTSLHSIAYCVRYLISHKIKPDAIFIIILAFHLIFCLDVIGAFFLEAEFKKLEESQNRLEEVNDCAQDAVIQANLLKISNERNIKISNERNIKKKVR